MVAGKLTPRTEQPNLNVEVSPQHPARPGVSTRNEFSLPVSWRNVRSWRKGDLQTTKPRFGHAKKMLFAGGTPHTSLECPTRLRVVKFGIVLYIKSLVWPALAIPKPLKAQVSGLKPSSIINEPTRVVATILHWTSKPHLQTSQSCILPTCNW